MRLALRGIRRRFRLSNARAKDRGSYALAAIPVGLLVWTILIADLAWAATADANIPLAGYVVILFAVLVSFVVGIELMALVVYSRRAGYRQPANLVRSDTAAARLSKIRPSSSGDPA